jgi:hypothetical protein
MPITQKHPTNERASSMRRHLTPSFAISLIALFVALGGSSYAAVKLKANSVTGREIKNGSVTLADLNKNIRPQKSNKLFRSAVVDTVTDPASGVTIHVQSEPGIVGPQGAAGASGAQGPSGTATVTTREAFGPTVGASQHTGAQADCLPGEKIVGGGIDLDGTPSDGFLQMSAPSGNGWNGDFITSASAATSSRAHVYALCAAG